MSLVKVLRWRWRVSVRRERVSGLGALFFPLVPMLIMPEHPRSEEEFEMLFENKNPESVSLFHLRIPEMKFGDPDPDLLDTGPSPCPSQTMLIVNLYPPNRGYTYSCFLPRITADNLETDPQSVNDQSFHQSHLIPYSETYLLDCIDSEIIPIRLLAKLDKYDGINLMCFQSQVLCEVRDFRRFPSSWNPNSSLAPSSPIIRQITLKPTNQSVLSDLDTLIEKGYEDHQLYKQVEGVTKKLVINGENDVTDGCPVPMKKMKLEPNGNNGTTFDGTDEILRTTSGSDDFLSLEQKFELEKEIVRETAPLLCLDPSRTVGLIANQAQYERLKWNSEELKKSVVNSSKRREKIRKAMEKDEEDDDIEDIYPGDVDRRSFIPFYRFVKKKRQLKKKMEKEVIAEILRLPPIIHSEFPPLLPPSNMEDINKIGQPAEPATLRTMFSENFVKKIEEYILETERRKRPHTTRLSIYQRNGNESYFGELEQESFIEPNGFNVNPPTPGTTIRPTIYPQTPGSSQVPSTKCQFELGSSRSVALYVKQFTDIFTEDGRRPCKITYQKIGQPSPQVVYTNSYKSLTNNNNNNTTTATNANASTVTVSTTAGPPSPVPTQGAGAAMSVPSSAAASVCQPIPPNSTPTVQVQASLPMAVAASVSTSQPPVQIVHPQPRTAQQQQQIQQVYTNATMISAPTTMTLTTNTASSAGTNVNFNLNVNSARIVRQQLLTRPQIINVNLQQQHPSQHIITRQNAPQLIQSQLTQQQGIRISKQPTLATLLLTGIHPNQGSKPITVAIQPQPHNSSAGTASTGQMQTIQIGNAIDAHHGHSQHVVHHQSQQQQHHHQSTSSPIMIMVSPATGNSQNTISIPSSSSSGNQQGHSGSVSLNLNAISLDGLLSSVSNSSNMSNYITTSVANSGNTVQVPMSLSNQLNTLNILRLSNSTNTVTLQPQQHAALMRQGNISVMSHAGRGGAGTSQQQTHTMMNMSATGILINPTTSNTQGHAGNISNLSGQHMNILQKTGTGPTRVQVQTPVVQELEELSVPDLNSLLNVNSNGNSTTFHNGPRQSTAAGTIDGRGLNLDLNLNLNLNLSGHSHGQGSSASATASVSSGREYDQNQGGHTSNGSGEVVTADGVDSFFNALSEAIGPELGQKLDGSSLQTGHNNQGMVSSSMSPSTPKSNCSSVITINDLLGSPPMMVSSSTNSGGPPVQSPLQMQLQSPQSPSISSILSPISPNIMAIPAPVAASVPSSLAYSTPRLSALLAGTPSADSTNIVTNLVDSSTSSGPNTGTGGRGGLPPSGSSYGNLLDRLAASRTQPQITHRTGGSLLSPIATATPSVVLEHPVLAATLTQGPNPNLHLRQGLTRPSYRQIAPAPPPQQQQQQQLINLLGLVSNPNNAPGGPASVPQATIRINSGNPSPGASGNLGSR